MIVRGMVDQPPWTTNFLQPKRYLAVFLVEVHKVHTPQVNRRAIQNRVEDMLSVG